MTDVRFRFASDILRRLGEELNPSADQGILELVKNSYDADARDCVVELHDVDGPEGMVRVVDDGLGMDARTIIDSWLVLGRSSKAPRDRTQLGRIPAGSKGLGRLAALRLGRFATLRTRPIGATVAYELVLDWDRFDSGATVEDIPLTIKEIVRRRSARHGTEIQLTDLRRRIRRSEVRNLARAMILLADPFSDDPTAFRPRLLSAEFSDLEALVNARYFTQAEYHLSSRLENGRGFAEVLDWRGESLYQGTHDELRRSGDAPLYAAPNSQLDLWVFLLTRTAFTSRDVSLGEVREWLNAFGGVHLYINGLRAAPYGNPGNDWLEMNLRRARGPEERPSTNTSIGRVSVDDPTGILTQKTDRTGLIEDESFNELRQFCEDSLDWMARRRLADAEKRRRSERTVSRTRSSRARESLAEQIENAPPKQRESLRQAYRTYERALERETSALRREVQLYRTLSTAGITTATFAHESSGNPIKVITQSATTIERRARRDLGDSLGSLGQPLEALRRAVESLAALASSTLRLLSPDKRRVGRVNLHPIMRSVVDNYETFSQTRNVSIDLQLADADPYLRGTEAAIESILSNLLNNSLAAFESSNSRRARTILVETEFIDGTFRLRVADSGPGISGLPLAEIWLPGETTRPGGTGLGLAIVRDAVEDLGGHVDAVAEGALGGAEFIVELPASGG